jgi:hypothetical protein
MMMLNTPRVRFFRSDETDQVEVTTGLPPAAGLTHFEPADYDGDVLYSEGYETVEEAVDAAVADVVLNLVDESWLDAITEETGWEGDVARALIVALEPDEDRLSGAIAAETLAILCGIPAAW